MKQKEDSKLDEKVNHLVIKLKTSYPNLYNSMGWRYVRQTLKDLYSNPSKNRFRN